MSLLLKNISLPLAHFTLKADLEMPKGATAIFGPSGAGKTSLLDLIAGLRTADSAFIQLNDVILTDTAKNVSVPAQRRGISYVPQDLALFPHLSVKQNLLYGQKKEGANDARFSLEHITEILEIQPLVSRRVTELSGGERQRVALGRALLASPRLLLLDEPLASLDAPLKSKIIPYFARIRDEFRIPMLYVTHDRFEALTLAEEIVVLVNGKVMQTGPVSGVFNHPANTDVAKLVGVETVFPGKVIGIHEGLASVEVGRTTLTALSPEAAAQNVFVCIRGEDVILQREAAPSSVRNRLAARIVSVRLENALVRIELDAGFPLLALVTRPACDELGLRAGETITALIKAPAIHLVAR